MQVKSNNVQHTRDLKKVINSTTNIFKNGDLLPVPKNIEPILTTAEQREQKKTFLM